MFVELGTTTNFSFLRGASHPEELVAVASGFAMPALGIADRNSLAGVVRAFSQAKRLTENPVRVLVGTRLVFADGTPDILAYPRNIEAYGRLCRLLTTGNRRAEKGSCILHREDLVDWIEGLQLIVLERSSAVPEEAMVHEDPAVGEVGIKDLRASDVPSPVRTGEGGPAQQGRMRVHSALINRQRRPALALIRHGSAATPSPARAGEGMLRALLHFAPPPRPANDNREANPDQAALLRRLAEAAPGRVWIGATMLPGPRLRARLAARRALARGTGLPLIATNDVLMHTPDRRPLADVLHCIRTGLPLDQAGRSLEANAERHLKSGVEMAHLFREAPGAVAETLRFAEGLRFSLSQLEYNYPDELRGIYETEQEALEAYARAGARSRYPEGVPPAVETQMAKELALVAELDYAAYFLTVYDVVQFARREGILCQGRGSAANSTLCYCLGITAIDPAHHTLLFERFISRNRKEPPDIDVDFEHERREAVMQYIYDHYGRAHAGLVATVITYRTRSALRDVGKAFGLSEDSVSALSGTVWGYWSKGVDPAEAKRIGLDPDEERLAMVLKLADELAGFPRHLSQHTGGFVITRTRLDEVVPITNAAMEGRTVVEWDKDDLDDLKMVKIDVLALGMLTCLKKGFDLLEEHYGHRVTMADLIKREQDESCVYDMICRADTIGVFQIESRAQMSMLPRLKPREFYDLVIEVAIVRPGPIQGDMVHPYLRRRQGLEEVSYPSPELEAVLEKTLGVPLFQEHAMKIAIVAAGFTPDEADQLRRAMATFKKVGLIGTFQARMIEGMIGNGYPRDFAEKCFNQIKGFGTYGFPESHAASFALLVYASAWLKCRYPDVFACALLNSQPMGFYAPAQIVRDARDHGVPMRPVDVNASRWDCTLEPPFSRENGRRWHEGADEGGLGSERPFANPGLPHAEQGAKQPCRSTQDLACFDTPPSAAAQDEEDPGLQSGSERIFIHDDCVVPPRIKSEGGPFPAHAGEGRLHPRHAAMRDDILGDHALRLGFRQVKGLQQADMDRLVARRGAGYDSVRDLWLRAELTPAVLERLAEADAFRSLGLDRRDALWAVRGLNRAGDKDDLPLFSAAPAAEREPDAALPPMRLGEHVVEDYRHLSLSLKAHPVSFVRGELARRRIAASAALAEAGNGRRVTVAGLVLVRQRPGSASGTIFLTLEDETGVANIIVWPKVFEMNRAAVIAARFLSVTGTLQHESGVTHVVAARFDDLTPLLTHLSSRGAEIQDLARADEVKNPQTFESKKRVLGSDLALKIGFPLAADTRTPKGEPASDPRRPEADLRGALREALPKGRNFH